MKRNPAVGGTARTGRAVAAAAVLAVVATGCGHSAAPDDPEPTSSAPDVPGQVSVKVSDIDLAITDAVAHLDASGNGTLTMTIRNGSGTPEHLDMVGTPEAGRGTLVGAPGKRTGMMTEAGILLMPHSSVTFGGTLGPAVRFSSVHGVTAAHTLPLALQFGVARLVHLTAKVAAR
ncbi:hypothetical protein AB0M29_42255 [Streptomyces sp. NPDC051976]|uniref:hypothetical protein n=1 Tax=Streptomyces sp. NPDC051976 TaxID=3154947 RepID=UPI003437B390